MSLFQLGRFVGHSGTPLLWKIECDALSRDDWACLAEMGRKLLPAFHWVHGVPRGGVVLARAMCDYVSAESIPGVIGSNDTVLVCDDVLTSGQSMEEARRKFLPHNVIGLVAFARGDWPSWVTPIFALHGCKPKEPVG